MCAIVSAKDLFVIQGSLTGECFPVEKFDVEGRPPGVAARLTNIAFLGTSVESGSATAVVAATGDRHYLGGMAESLPEQTTQTAFDRASPRFTWLMLRVHARDGPAGLRHQRRDQGHVGRGVLLRGGGGGRAHPRNAADDRHRLPVQGGGSDGHRRRSSSSASTRSRTSAHGCALHGQDRDTHARRDHPREVLRRLATREPRRARACVHQ